MNEGWIRLYRKTMDSFIMKNSHLYHFWGWCLLKASYRETKVCVGFTEVVLQPGQFIFGRKNASLETGMSEQTIRTCLKKLEKSENLTIKSTNKFSIVTIVNWDTYQYNDGVPNHQINHQVTSSQPASNQQVTSNQPTGNHKQEVKEVKEGKKRKEGKEENINTFCPEVSSDTTSPEAQADCFEPEIIEPEIFDPADTVILEIPLIPKDGAFGVTAKMMATWQEAYPGVNVEMELRKCQQWNDADTKRRKTRGGIQRHIVSWLSRAQDKGSSRTYVPNQAQQFQQQAGIPIRSRREMSNLQAGWEFIHGE